MDERVLQAMLPYFVKQYGNAASKSHVFGWQANDAVEQAREQVAALINASPHEIIFTSGATESINLALKGIFEMYAAKGNHIITCVTEHKAVLDTCHHLEKMGASISYIPVAQNGLINLQKLEAAIQPATILIAVMYANNETGILQPVEKISALAKKYAVPFFSDATQAAGKIPLDVLKEGIDVMAFNAHKNTWSKKRGGIVCKKKKSPHKNCSANRWRGA